MNLVLGLCGLAVAAVSVVVGWRARRKVVRWAAILGQLAGWQLCWTFLIRPFVPPMVAAGVLLGGIVVAIFAVAIVSTYKYRKNR
jgi:hypothetical protein